MYPRRREAALLSMQVWNQFDMNVSRELIVTESESNAFEAFSTCILLSFSGQFPKNIRDKLSTENGLVGRAIPAPSARCKEV